jgi:hypothetical protein
MSAVDFDVHVSYTVASYLILVLFHPMVRRIFRMVVIDEASQATEPAVLVPLIKGAQCVVMAGEGATWGLGVQGLGYKPMNLSHQRAGGTRDLQVLDV